MSMLPDGYDSANEDLFQQVNKELKKNISGFGRQLEFFSDLTAVDDCYYGSDLLLQFLGSAPEDDALVHSELQQSVFQMPMASSMSEAIETASVAETTSTTPGRAGRVVPIFTPGTSVISKDDNDRMSISEWGTIDWDTQSTATVETEALDAGGSVVSWPSLISSTSRTVDFSEMSPSSRSASVAPDISRAASVAPSFQPAVNAEFGLDLESKAPVVAQYHHVSDGPIQYLSHGAILKVVLSDKLNGFLRPFSPSWISSQIPKFPELMINPQQLTSAGVSLSAELQHELGRAPVNQMVDLRRTKPTQGQARQKMVILLPARIVQYTRLLLVRPVSPDNSADAATIKHLAFWVYRSVRCAQIALQLKKITDDSVFWEFMTKEPIDMSDFRLTKPPIQGVLDHFYNGYKQKYSSPVPEIQVWFLSSLLRDYLLVAERISQAVYIKLGGTKQELRG